MLLVIQDTRIALNIRKRILFVENGAIYYEGAAQEVAVHPEIRMRYLVSIRKLHFSPPP